MRKNTLKFALSLVLLAGSLGAGVSAAVNTCKSPCCDASCATYRPCHSVNGVCVCSACVPWEH